MSSLPKWGTSNARDTSFSQLTFQYNLLDETISSKPDKETSLRCPGVYASANFMAFELSALASSNRVYPIGKGDFTERLYVAQVAAEYKEQFRSAGERLNYGDVRYKPSKLAVGINPMKRNGHFDFNIVVTFITEGENRGYSPDNARRAFDGEREYTQNEDGKYTRLNDETRLASPHRLFKHYEREVALNFHIPITYKTFDQIQKEEAKAVEEAEGQVKPEKIYRYMPKLIFRGVISKIDRTMAEALSPEGLSERFDRIDPLFQKEFVRSRHPRRDGAGAGAAADSAESKGDHHPMLLALAASLSPSPPRRRGSSSSSSPSSPTTFASRAFAREETRRWGGSTGSADSSKSWRRFDK